MRTAILLGMAALPLITAAQAFSDDFESYTAGSYIAENSNGLWTTWSEAPGGTEDALASDDQAHSGSISAEFESTSTSGGPTDFVHHFDNLSSGHYVFTLWINVVEGSGGYFNLLHTGGSSPVWALGAYFNGDGTGHVSAGGVDHAFTHTVQNWNEVMVDINMDADTCNFYMNGTQVGGWQWSVQETSATGGTNTLDWLDIFAYGGSADYLAHFYVDDVSFQSGGVGVNELMRPDAVQAWPNPAKDILNVDLGSDLTAQARVELVDLAGQVLTVPSRQEGQVLHMDMSSLTDGVYFVRVSDGSTQRIGKVMKH